jgi:hypothetical protein
MMNICCPRTPFKNSFAVAAATLTENVSDVGKKYAFAAESAE